MPVVEQQPEIGAVIKCGCEGFNQFESRASGKAKWKVQTEAEVGRTRGIFRWKHNVDADAVALGNGLQDYRTMQLEFV